MSALAPGVDLERVKSKIPWDLKVASHLEKFPVPTDVELNFLRKFSPRSCFTTKECNDLLFTGAIEKFAKKEFFYQQTRVKMAQAV